MPKEGIFCRVLEGGKLQAGSWMEYHPRQLQVRIVTLSDRASRGEYEDKSGPMLEQLVREFFSREGRYVSSKLEIIPDDPDMLRQQIGHFVKEGSDIIFTTGGTGIGPRDITPDTVRPLLTMEIPGIMEMIRVKYGMQAPNALLSRSLAGVIKGTLVYVLPGSPKAVKEYTDEIFKTIEHSLRMLHQIDTHA
jgi:molybdenum cofactor synthesis domain-containing protein